MSATALAPISPTSFPWALVDRVLEVEPRRRAVGEKLVSANEPYFVGHFPGAPVFPGVVLCEALAQLAGVLAEDDSVRLVGVERARFRRPVLPGDRLELHVKKAQSRGNVWKFDGKAVVDGKVAAEATFAAMIRDK